MTVPLDIVLVFPSECDEAEVMAFRDAFLHTGDSLHGSAGLDAQPDYRAWLAAVRDNRSEQTVRPGLAPATTLLARKRSDGTLVGMIDLRHRLTNGLLQYGGHIGYCVHPAHRRRGYASQMLALALEEYRRRNVSRVLIVCSKANTASARTILRNGGVLENEVAEEDSTLQRYWIKL